MILPWQQATWRRLVDGLPTLHHALLLAGPAGQGKRQFAEAAAARLLCEAPGVRDFACGKCEACQWVQADSHPDLLRLVPDLDGDTGEDPEGKDGGKAKSAQIRIEQVRALTPILTVTAHRGGRRVVIVDPAEAMNPFTANALLKLLEEPPAGVVFLLVSARPMRLLPTLRSRCQRWDFPMPSAEAVAGWLRDSHPGTPQELVDLVGGAPLAAADLSGRGGQGLRSRLVADLTARPGVDPVRLAGQWEAWLRGKEAQAAGLDLAMLVGWVQRWVTDLAALRLGGIPRYFPDQGRALAAIAGTMTVADALACYNDFIALRRVSQHPLNSRLMMEDMLIRYCRAVGGGGP
ncbi:MAG: DNA polymerase III subunit delta' [Zoogloeaceae bacterium]|nr:DNA polymerase III subunit delta' [Zoogloeaceae bacterium]